MLVDGCSEQRKLDWTQSSGQMTGVAGPRRMLYAHVCSRRRALARCVGEVGWLGNQHKPQWYRSCGVT